MTNIVQYPDPSLNVPVPKLHIDEFGGLPHVHQTLTEAMQEYGAVGIAANQLGQDVRACLVLDKFLVNPTIVEQQGNTTYELEGCLSIEYGKKGYIRPAREEVSVLYQDIEGNQKAYRFKDFEARVALHEIRHLDGKLINEGIENE
jgi:peptide deformylase